MSAQLHWEKAAGSLVSPGSCFILIFPLLILICVLLLEYTVIVSKMALLSFVRSSSELLKLRVSLETPELQRFIHIVACISTQFFFTIE